MICPTCNNPLQSKEHLIHEILTLTGCVVGIFMGAFIGPKIFDVCSPMHPLEKQFYPLRDPSMMGIGAMIGAYGGMLLAQQVAKRVFAQRPHLA